jgi:hypothetical protein
MGLMDMVHDRHSHTKHETHTKHERGNLMSPTLEQTVQDLAARLDDTQARLAQSEARHSRAERRLRTGYALAFCAVALTLLLNIRPAAMAQTPGVSLASLLARITSLEQKTAPITLSGTDLTVKGVNVHIVDGTGSTASSSGLGNLIIGYNAGGTVSGTGGGSHNLVLGDANNYTSYGGLIAGDDNTISGAYASVTGGSRNTASGEFASISGGYFNTASGGEFASVSGGFNNYASGDVASVSGGYDNHASGPEASVSGGESNYAAGEFASISGGDYNTASGFASSVYGGYENTASGIDSISP